MVFGCISKNFPENIFWCLEEKKENTNPEKHKQIKASSFKYFYRKCIKSGKRNQNPAKENESLTSDDRCDRGATSDERRPHRAISSIVLVDRAARRRGAIVRRAARLTITIAPLVDQQAVRVRRARSSIVPLDRRSCRSIDDRAA